MLRWYITATGLTASNQSLADQDLSGLLLILSAQYKVISVITSINSMQTSCFFALQYLNAKTSFTGGARSDFLSSQTLASSEQISSFSSFIFECVFLVLVTQIILLVVSLGLLYYY